MASSNWFLRVLLTFLLLDTFLSQEQISVLEPSDTTTWEQGKVYSIVIKYTNLPKEVKQFEATFLLLDSTYRVIYPLGTKMLVQYPNMIDTETISNMIIPVTVDLGNDNYFRIQVKTSDLRTGQSRLFIVKKYEAPAEPINWWTVALYVLTPILMLVLVICGAICMYNRIMNMEKEKEEEENMIREAGGEVENNDPLSVQIEEGLITPTSTSNDAELEQYGQLKDDDEK